MSGGDNRENNEQADLNKFLNKQQKMREDLQRQKLHNARAETVNDWQQRRVMKGIQDADRKAQENFAKMKEAGKRNSSQYHVGSIASWIMEGADRFEAIAKFYEHKGAYYRKKYIGSYVSGFIVGGAAHVYASAKGLGDAKIEIPDPDLKFTVDIDSSGRLTNDWLYDTFGELLLDENGEFSEEVAAEVRTLLNAVIRHWIDSLDGVDPDDGGYFVAQAKDESGNLVDVIYPKSSGKEGDGNVWHLDDDKVIASYEEQDREQINGHWVPKLGAIPKLHQADLTLDEVKFKSILEGRVHPEKSLNTFIQNTLEGISVSYEAPTPPSMGM